jgi:hypothetical protein
MGVKPGDGAACAVALVLRLHEHVAFVFVEDELGFNAESFEAVPEFVGLRRGAFAVAVADDHQGWRFHVLDEGDGRAFPVDLWIVVDGLAEKRHHPLVDFVFAVVALIVGDAGLAVSFCWANSWPELQIESAKMTTANQFEMRMTTDLSS